MWPKVEFEECRWERNSGEFDLIPRSRRKKILPTYFAAVPASIADKTPEVSREIYERISEVSFMANRFDMAQINRSYNLPALLLRSESASSSQIENLTSSVRNVALAEVSSTAPHNAKIIAGNVAAMRMALSFNGPLTKTVIRRVYTALMRLDDTSCLPGFREEQVWIGGSSYSPHGATFVPPHFFRLDEHLDDLVAFAARKDINPIIKAALAHAQFETIHPFTDGNGRTGRTLLHQMLAADGVVEHAALPISAGLLHDSDAYMNAIRAYHEGDIEPIILQLVSAIEIACALGSTLADEVDIVLAEWKGRNTDRKGSSSHRLPDLLVEQPVVDTKYVSQKLGITDRAARSLVEVACEREILTKMGNAQRGVYYQASELIAVLEDASRAQSIRRIASARRRIASAR